MSTIITLVYIALVIAIFYVLLKERRDPAETLAWMLVILMLLTFARYLATKQKH